MKRNLQQILSLITLFASINCASGNGEVEKIEKLFQSENVTGTLIITSLHDEKNIIYNAKRADTRFSPASTFKILNTLIGLKYEAITADAQDTIFKWDGKNRGIRAWNQDHSLTTAFKTSCVWCYQKIAKAVGISNYQQALKSTAYGNQNARQPVDMFWLNNALKISATEQVDFLQRLVKNDLPYSLSHQKILKQIMQVEKHSNYTLYAKSGWTGKEQAIGWYVGYIKIENNTFPFAMNMTLTDARKLSLRKKLVIESFKALQLIR